MKLSHPVSDWFMRCEPSAGLDQTALPDAVKTALRQVVTDMGHRKAQPKFAHGNPGISVLFTGPSRAKAIAADAIAYELDAVLYSIDLSAVLEKYLGDTKKKLALLFDDAERAQAVLFFDEADVLFGKRTKLADAHDRYADVEIGYILERLRNYSGLAIFAINTNGRVNRPSLGRPCLLVEIGPPCM